MENTTNTSFGIPDQNFRLFEKKLAKLAKRAEKLGMDPIGYTVVGEHFREHRDPETDELISTTHYTDIVVHGANPHYEGWHFVAAVEWVDEQAITFKSPLVDDDVPVSFREVDPSRCDQCHTNRFRRQTYIIHHSETDDWKVVGSTCLHDFLGWKTPENVAAMASLLEGLWGLCEAAEDDSWGGTGGPTGMNVRTFLAFSAAAIEQDGWQKRTGYDPYYCTVPPTADTAMKAMFPPKEKVHHLPPEYTPEERHYETAEKAIEWVADNFGAKDVMERSDYEHSLAVAMGAEWAPFRLAGILASGIMVYQRAMDKLREAEARKLAGRDSQYFGEVKQRLVMNVALVSHRCFDSEWGTTHLYKFVTVEGGGIPAGCDVTYFSSRDMELDAEDDRSQLLVTLKATIKKHEEYNGVKQNVITRATVLEGEKAEKALAKQAA